MLSKPVFVTLGHFLDLAALLLRFDIRHTAAVIPTCSIIIHVHVHLLAKSMAAL